jgi:antitoxin YefM
MGFVSYTQLRQHLKKHLDEVCKSRAPLLVMRQNGEGVVVLALEEYEIMQEMMHLNRSPANAEHLRESIAASTTGSSESALDTTRVV